MRKLSLLLIFCLVSLAACGGGDEDKKAKGKPRGAKTAKKEPPKPVLCPLTGKEAPSGLDSSRPALAVKIDNSGPGRPQAGLESADIVYEELAEGGITRFLAVFHCADAASVGPVRSSRLVDPDILQEYEPALFAYSGAAPPVLAKVGSTKGVVDLRHGSNAGAYRREPGRRSPLNLFTSTEKIRSLENAKDVEGPPKIGLEFQAAASPSPIATATKSAKSAGSTPAVAATSPAAPPAAPGASVTFSYGAGAPTRYTYDAAGASYLRFHGAVPHKTNDGQQVKATNVVILKVRITAGTIKDKAGNSSPEITVTGTGEAVVLKDGASVTGKWTRTGLADKTRLTDAAGAPLKLSPGNTWIHYVPAERPVTVG